jgi:pimeloyl-ACP methyl ester carboxylesterase
VLPFTRRYRFILPDLRGFGGSHDVPFTSPDIFTNFTRDLEDVLDHLSIDKVALGGVSMGAFTSLHLAAAGLFSRVSKYLHIDQSPQVRNDATWRYGVFGEDQEQIFGSFRRLLELADRAGHGTDYWRLPADLRLDMRRAAAEFFCYAFNGPRQQAGVRRFMLDAERLVTHTLMPVERWPSYLSVMRAYMDGEHDLRPALGKIHVPVTLMVGMRSRMYPAAGQLAMREGIPHAKVVRFERSGHVPMIDEPIRFQRALGEFLAA